MAPGRFRVLKKSLEVRRTYAAIHGGICRIFGLRANKNAGSKTGVAAKGLLTMQD
jgi:hypothetical protein